MLSHRYAIFPSPLHFRPRVSYRPVTTALFHSISITAITTLLRRPLLFLPAIFLLVHRSYLGGRKDFYNIRIGD
ncbi:hypothetical protein B0H12DRAFT_733982 [Mycena haematopus]|nr:hypothetical protein B0H12DRAFT_733982 [Mycena haematopus]